MGEYNGDVGPSIVVGDSSWGGDDLCKSLFGVDVYDARCGVGEFSELGNSSWGGCDASCWDVGYSSFDVSDAGEAMFKYFSNDSV